MDQKKTLLAIKKELGKKIHVERVLLFGSRARGDFYPDSDYDIAVISKDFVTLSFKERHILVQPIIRKILINVSLDVLCYTPEEYRKSKNGYLGEHIAQEGIAV